MPHQAPSQSHHRWPSQWPVLQTHDGAASAALSLHGGQLLSWFCSGKERLFVSPLSPFAAGKAVRGGVPVIYPQFGERGPGLRHGFARQLDWEPLDSDAGTLAVRLADSGDTRSIWPNRFELVMRATLGDRQLAIALTVRNLELQPIPVQVALHTYLGVDDITCTRLHGLQGCHYESAVDHGARLSQSVAELAFDGEVDRIYLDPPPAIELEDGPSRLRIEQSGFAETVVWNPGAALATTMPELGPDGHRDFVCVEAAQATKSLILNPGECWLGSQTLTVLTAPLPRLG